MTTIRFYSLLSFFLVIFGTLTFRLYGVQLKSGGDFFASAKAMSNREIIMPRRGAIYATDKNRNRIPVALLRDISYLYAVPIEIVDAEKTAQILLSVLNLPRARIIASFKKKNDEFELLASRLTPTEAASIRALNLKGLYVSERAARTYPFNNSLAHVLGFVGQGDDGEERGRYGVELSYDDELSGNSGKEKNGSIEAPVDGSELVLTIDRNVQVFVEDVLERVSAQQHAKAGTVIVEDPTTGRIIAMANTPTFDPNEFGKTEVSSFLNPAVQAIYEPGSVFKVITMASALDSGAVTPNTVFNDKGFLKLNTRTIKNWDKKAHGKVTMTQVIEESINTGAAYAESQMGHTEFLKYLELFGPEETTDIELPGELQGSIRSLKQHAQDINFATVSFGQGIAVTPIGLVRMVSAIANGGIMMKPFIDNRKMPQVIRRVVSEKAAQDVIAMMVSSVNKAKVAKVDGYAVAGKTGTAQIPDFKHGGYEKAFIHTFVGFAPASEPKFLVLIKLDRPDAELAGSTVVPAFHEIADFLLRYYSVPPDGR